MSIYKTIRQQRDEENEQAKRKDGQSKTKMKTTMRQDETR
jgi:hypothetical protein